MKPFEGFNSNQSQSTAVPAEFFSVLLPKIENIFELKLVLFIIWYLENNEMEHPVISIDQIKNDVLFVSCLGKNKFEQNSNLISSIHFALEDGILLDLIFEDQSEINKYFCLNTPHGRELSALVQSGSIILDSTIENAIKLNRVKPNIFELYEENIGIITPVIADSLKELENEYPTRWIEEAFQEAVKNNVRKFRYIEVILQNWQKEGKHERTDRRRSQKDQEKYDPEKYIDGEFSDFIDH